MLEFILKPWHPIEGASLDQVLCLASVRPPWATRRLNIAAHLAATNGARPYEHHTAHYLRNTGRDWGRSNNSIQGEAS